MGFLTLTLESWVRVTVPELKRAWRLQFTEENKEATEEGENQADGLPSEPPGKPKPKLEN